MISTYYILLSNIVIYFVQINTIYEYYDDTYDVSSIYGIYIEKFYLLNFSNYICFFKSFKIIYIYIFQYDRKRLSF